MLPETPSSIVTSVEADSTSQRADFGSALVQSVVNSAELCGSIWMKRSVEMQDHYHHQLSQLEPKQFTSPHSLGLFQQSPSTQPEKGVIAWSCTSSGETEGMSVPMPAPSVVERGISQASD